MKSLIAIICLVMCYKTGRGQVVQSPATDNDVEFPYGNMGETLPGTKVLTWGLSDTALSKKILNGAHKFIDEKINEYIMTTLRTKWGMDLALLKERFDRSLIEDVEKRAVDFIEDGKIKSENGKLLLTTKGKLFADYIASMLFIDNDLANKS